MRGENADDARTLVVSPAGAAAEERDIDIDYDNDGDCGDEPVATWCHGNGR